MIGLEVENLDDKATLLAPFTIARVISAKQHPNADRLRVCMVDTGKGDPVQVVCGAPNARSGMMGVFVPPGAYIPGKDITLRRRQDPRRREPRHAGLRDGDAALRRPRGHHRAARRRAARRGLRQMGRARRSGDRDQAHAQPAGLHRRARHRARPRRRRHGQVHRQDGQAGERHRRLPARGHARLRHDALALPRLCAAAGARREERPVAGLAAEAPHRDRAAARSMRWSTSPTSSPTTAAGRCTCSTPPR